ncbi:hypothetical protein [Frondihabitans sucicola]|uniref:hypothetical protein n=1 Tax=Frondihabitans sucicola TaxID=1268041 RepID=UPI0025741453|nr:hypothetical protein [Frondihabitans sucicola]
MAPAHAFVAGPNELSAQLKVQLHKHLAEGGIPLDVQESLIAKMEAGKQLDSFTGAAPIESFIDETADMPQTVSVFADGSRRITAVELPADAGAARTGLSGCVSSSGWKINCKISVWDPISSAKFTIDYQTSTSSKAKVRSFRGASCAVVGIPSSCSLPSPTGIARAAQSSAGSAWARVTYKAQSGPLHAKGEFGIRVTGTNVSVY